VPIMAVTAYAAKGDEERIRDAGAEGYVSKPISVVRFVEAVRALLAAPRPVEAAAREVRVSRGFAASAETVFDSWLDQSTVGKWLFATPGGERIRVEIDPRVGGQFEIVERREGQDVAHVGRYEAIERPRRLVFSLAVPLYSAKSERVEIDILPEAAGCRLSLAQTFAPDAPASPERIARGWSAMLEALAGLLEGKGAEA
jgi:uncharacterized protein YndB with AHSA1/START domain